MAAKTKAVAVAVAKPTFGDVTFNRTPEYRSVYANVIRTAIGPWDIRLTFGQMADTMPPTAVCDELVSVIMSPMEIKAALGAIKQAVEQYESLYGEIKDLTPVLEKMKEEAGNAKAKD